MDQKGSSPSLFQLDSMELKRNGIPEASPLSKPQNSNVTITMSSSPKSESGDKSIDYQQRAQWLRAAVLGANDGLVTTASLMMGVGAVKKDSKTMVMSGLGALVAGACSMAIGEYVSVQTQRDVELSNLKREKKAKKSLNAGFEQPTYVAGSPFSSRARMSAIPLPPGSPLVISSAEREGLPNPIQAACASALAFSVGALLPLISAAFISEYIIRVGVLAGVSTLALIMFGAIGAYFGRSSMVKGSVRVLIGGWIAMLITYGLLRLFRATAGV